MTNSLKWTGLVATLVIIVILPLYAFAESAQQEDLLLEYNTNSVLAATDLYANNCVVCHGALGEGIGDNPALNNEALRLMSETDIYKVVSRGRDNTLMAAWGVEEGGILSNHQIQSIVTLIQQANWEYVEARVAELGLTPPELIKMEVSEEMLQTLAELPDGERLNSGLVLYAENCSACHGANGAGTIIAPAIDSPELRATPQDELIDLVSSGVPGTLMAGWQDNLAPEQITSVVELVYRWPELVNAGIEFPEAEVTNIPSSPELIQAGNQLFNIACKSCHGADGFGTPMAPALNNQLFLTETPDAAIYQIIAGGVPQTLMPGWGNRLSDEDLRSLVAYLRSLEPSAPAILPPILE